MGVPEYTAVLEGMVFTEWIEVPRDFLQWRAGSQKTRPARTIGPVGPNRESLLDAHGVYLLSEFLEPPLDRSVRLTADPIIYVGKAALQSFYKRWTNTHEAWTRLGQRYRSSEGKSWFFSLATVRRNEIRGRVWSEEMQICIDSIHIEYLEKAVRELLRAKNSHYLANNIGD